MLSVIDEHSRECLAIHVRVQIKNDDVLAVLTELFARHGLPAHILLKSQPQICATGADGGQGTTSLRQRRRVPTILTYSIVTLHAKANRC